MIKTFRGTLPETDGSDQASINKTVERIHLTGLNAGIGYKIKKLSIMPERPLTDSNEAMVKLHSNIPTSINVNVDFDDSSLLAVAMYSNRDDTTYYPDDFVLIIDSERVVSQDMYLSYDNPATTGRIINYMLELEQIKLTGPQEAVLNFNQTIENTS